MVRTVEDSPNNMVVAVVTFLTSSAKVTGITFFAQSVAWLSITPTSLVNGLVSFKLHYESCPQIFDKKTTPNEVFNMGISLLGIRAVTIVAAARHELY